MVLLVYAAALLLATLVSDTLAGNAAAARVLVQLPWPEDLLVGAALTPTDPVFASATVGREEASVVSGLLVLSSGGERASIAYHVIAITTALSIVLHSSTDVPVSRWLGRETQTR